ncbi:type II secretion system protein GspL [Vibrio sp. SM6]|uniref:Type II secretion system protein L n=1 Tax=Vibrio agarilyticus TaxID=2726741 RepID=A0A7X8TTT2_9VIBR|nr:type II secretion system protein GspL [Vibrio agarilyticus]
MSEFLTVRLSSEQHHSVPWLVWSTSQQEVIASGELPNQEHLDQLVAYAEQRSIIVLVAASDVMMTQVTVPPGGARQFDAMLPYLVEDETAQDVDALHFTVVEKSAGQAHIVAIERAFVQRTLEQFRALGLDVKKMLPDCLALPFNGDAASAVKLGQQWLIRLQPYQGAALDESWMPLYLDAQAGDAPLPIDCYSDLPVQTGSRTWRAQPAEMAMALLAKGAIASKVNLLSGHFKAKSSLLKHLKVWQKAALAGGLLAISLLVQQALTLHQLEQETAAYRAERDRVFRQVMPGKKKIPTVSYLKRTLNDEVSRLSGGGSDSLLLPWLNQLPATLGSVSGMELLSVKYDGSRDEMRLQARSQDFQTFEQARLKLAAEFTVEQGQLNRNTEGVVGSFVLTRK